MSLFIPALDSTKLCPWISQPASCSAIIFQISCLNGNLWKRKEPLEGCMAHSNRYQCFFHGLMVPAKVLRVVVLCNATSPNGHFFLCSLNPTRGNNEKYLSFLFPERVLQRMSSSSAGGLGHAGFVHQHEVSRALCWKAEGLWLLR